MDPVPLDVDALLGSRLTITREQMEQYKSREQYIALGVDLLRDVGKIAAALASVYPLDSDGQPRRWTRNESIVGGPMVRLTKLQRGLYDAMCADHLEIAVILMRCLGETALNIEYLLRLGSDSLYDDYVEYSLREEKRLVNLIDENIAKRGQALPIETHMKSSAMHWFEVSGVNFDQVNAKSYQPWGEKIYQRAKKIESEMLYRTGFSLQNHSIHGNWQDLLWFHLEKHDDGFSPVLAWHRASAEAVLTAAIISINACGWYLTERAPESPDRDRLNELLVDYFNLGLDALTAYGEFDGTGFAPLGDDPSADTQHGEAQEADREQ
jgi:hypothetical protein